VLGAKFATHPINKIRFLQFLSSRSIGPFSFLDHPFGWWQILIPLLHFCRF